jgi:predicted enzyme related to lactoylglutathione lyase
MIERLGFASVTVKDPDAALSFYVEKLGFEKRRDYHFPGLPRFVTVAPKNQKEVELVLVQAGASNVRGAPAGHTGMVFWTDDCKREYERLKAKGVNFTEGPKKMPFGIQAMFMDIDGNLFALSQPSEGLT